jgi:hypothetical protein
MKYGKFHLKAHFGILICPHVFILYLSKNAMVLLIVFKMSYGAALLVFSLLPLPELLRWTCFKYSRGLFHEMIHLILVENLR